MTRKFVKRSIFFGTRPHPPSTAPFLLSPNAPRPPAPRAPSPRRDTAAAWEHSALLFLNTALPQSHKLPQHEDRLGAPLPRGSRRCCLRGRRSPEPEQAAETPGQAARAAAAAATGRDEAPEWGPAPPVVPAQASAGTPSPQNPCEQPLTCARDAGRPTDGPVRPQAARAQGPAALLQHTHTHTYIHTFKNTGYITFKNSPRAVGQAGPTPRASTGGRAQGTAHTPAGESTGGAGPGELSPPWDTPRRARSCGRWAQPGSARAPRRFRSLSVCSAAATSWFTAEKSGPQSPHQRQRQRWVWPSPIIFKIWAINRHTQSSWESSSGREAARQPREQGEHDREAPASPTPCACSAVTRGLRGGRAQPSAPGSAPPRICSWGEGTRRGLVRTVPRSGEGRGGQRAGPRDSGAGRGQRQLKAAFGAPSRGRASRGVSAHLPQVVWEQQLGGQEDAVLVAHFRLTFPFDVRTWGREGAVSAPQTRVPSPVSSLLLRDTQSPEQGEKWQHCGERDSPGQSRAWPPPRLLGSPAAADAAHPAPTPAKRCDHSRGSRGSCGRRREESGVICGPQRKVGLGGGRGWAGEER